MIFFTDLNIWFENLTFFSIFIIELNSFLKNWYYTCIEIKQSSQKTKNEF